MPNSKPLEAADSPQNHVKEMYKNWFLDYASYVILERAIPDIADGLKPVQRRILHALKEMDDGRFNKVANVIGSSMQFHPHGDASIGDAIINLGQKNLLIDTQGNWGDIRTGDSAAAPRYIEARLSKFALEVAFNAKTTEWQLSYDGRKNEPVHLPMKFPLLLAQGAEGIAVGLSTKILPHNFIELIKASIKHLQGKRFKLLPDFPNGGMMDAENYNDGKRGGKVRVRANIEKKDNKTLLIKDVPYGCTTHSIIESIIKASDNNKLKVKKVTDNTAADVEIEVEIASGLTADQTIDALYAFTQCEISISPNICVIVDSKPCFISATEMLKQNTDNTKELLKRELEIKLKALEDKWHYTSLEKIFFEEKIYKELEKKHKDWETVLKAIEKAFAPYKKKLKRAVTREDVVKLTEKPVRRIYKLDIDELIQQIKNLEAEIKQTKHDLKHLTDFAVAYFENLLEKYGKGRERKTEIKPFDNITVKHIAIANTKLYVNRKDGFIGSGLKKDELLFECADVDDIIAITQEGIMKVVKVGDKTFIGKNILHVAVWKKGDERTTYNMMYVDGKTGKSYAKRFNVKSITRNKEYHLTKGNPKSKVHYLTVNPSGESEIVMVNLSSAARARIKKFEYDFADLSIKGRGSMGNQVTKYGVRSVKLISKGTSSLPGEKMWYDDKVGRMVKEAPTNSKGSETGIYLGDFHEGDLIISFYQNGSYKLHATELSTRFDNENLIRIEKFNPDAVISAVWFDAKKKQFFAKRFKVETQSLNSEFLFIKEGEKNYLEWISSNHTPIIILKTGKKKYLPSEQTIDLTEFVDVKGWKSIGNKLCDKDLLEISLVEQEGDKTTGELF
jgi:topoisomerase-4 subunit A